MKPQKNHNKAVNLDTTFFGLSTFNIMAGTLKTLWHSLGKEIAFSGPFYMLNVIST